MLSVGVSTLRGEAHETLIPANTIPIIFALQLFLFTRDDRLGKLCCLNTCDCDSLSFLKHVRRYLCLSDLRYGSQLMCDTNRSHCARFNAI